MSDAPKRAPLRIGVMVDSLVVPRWVESILRSVVESEFLHLVVVLVNAEEQEHSRSFRARLRRFRRHGLYSLYHRRDFERRRTSDDAFASVDASELIGDATILRVLPRRPRPFEHRFDDFTTARLREVDLDVVLRFGFGIIRGEILDVARHGVWSYHHGDNREYRGGPAMFWEMYHGEPVTGTTLQILTEELDGGKVIYRAFSATDPVSLYRSQNDTYWKASAFMLRRLTDLYERGWDFIAALPTYSERTRYTKRIHRQPTNRQMLLFGVKLALRLVRQRLRAAFFRRQWFLTYWHGARDLGPPENAEKPRRVQPPRTRFFADPFATERRGRHVVFFEDFDYATDLGRISYVEVSPDGHTEPQVALELDYHLSYPFTFEWEGKHYMIPETAANRTIELYRARPFTNRWVLDRVLMEGVYALDSTLLHREGRWWLFANMADPDRPIRVEDELFLFSSGSLEEPWVPHPLNPIVSDVRCARPAGRILVRDGKVIRPAQDSSRGYGGAIVLNEIEILTEEDYREVAVGRIEPTWARKVRGTHCWTTDGTYGVVDGYRLQLKRPW